MKSKQPGKMLPNEVVLFNKIQSSDYHGTQKVLQRGVNVNCDYASGETPLILSVLTSKMEITKLLLDYGATVNERDSEKGWSALHYAVLDDSDKSIVELLIQYGADVNMEDSWGRSPLHLTCIYNTFEIMKVLVNFKANINMPTSVMKRTPLHIATDFHRIEFINFLLNCHCNFHMTDKDGETPMDCASRKQLSDVVDIFEEKQRQLRHDAFYFLFNFW